MGIIYSEDVACDHLAPHLAHRFLFKRVSYPPSHPMSLWVAREARAEASAGELGEGTQANPLALAQQKKFCACHHC